MKKILSGSLIGLLLFATPILAQITITSNQLPMNPGTQITNMSYGSTTVTVDLGQFGPNRTWNFSAMNPTNPYEGDWIDCSSSPYASSFPQANRCFRTFDEEQLVDVYQYYQSTTTDVWWRGAVYDVIGNPQIIPIDNSMSQVHLPISFPNQWTSVFEYEYSPVITIKDSTVHTVDAWGTITEDLGTFNCLRVKNSKTSTTIFSGNPIVNTFYQYEWYVPNYGALVTIMSTANEANPNFTEGFFSHISSLSTAVIEPPQPTELPQRVSLEAAYPNPFNPETRLSFTLPHVSVVSLAVYDISGKEVANLHQGWLPAGRYQSSFNAANLSSGVYFARLEADGMTQTQTLILVK